ncbi:MAG: hypothetical protein AAB875_06070 [Patescibacteria group bacterium]
MSKLILIAVFIILAIFAVFLFNVFSRAARYCWAYKEAECKTRLLCKPTNEYGLHCGEDGCKEGERFKECSPRF